MRYLIRKIQPKHKDVIKDLNHFNCLNADLNHFFLTENREVSTYIVDDLNLERAMYSLAAAIYNGFDLESYFVVFKIADIKNIAQDLKNIDITINRTEGKSLDKITNNYHYDIYINSITQSKDFYKLLFENYEYDLKEIQPNDVKLFFEDLYSIESSDISWEKESLKRAIKNNIISK